eukprot:403362895
MSAKELKVSPLRFTDKICVVTGGLSGIGFAISQRLLKEGAAAVIAMGLPNEKTDESNYQELLNARLDKEKQQVLVYHGDLTNSQWRSQVVSDVTTQFGHVDVLFANAGVGIQAPTMTGHLSEENYDKLFNVNVKSQFFLIKDFLPLMRKQPNKMKSILVTSSNAGINPVKQFGVYGMTKAALNNMVKWLAQELSADNIRVNSICPGLTDTQMITSQSNYEKLKKIYPKKSVGKPEDIAAVACMITSEIDGAFINGESYSVHGGFAKL